MSVELESIALVVGAAAIITSLKPYLESWFGDKTIQRFSGKERDVVRNLLVQIESLDEKELTLDNISKTIQSIHYASEVIELEDFKREVNDLHSALLESNVFQELEELKLMLEKVQNRDKLTSEDS